MSLLPKSNALTLPDMLSLLPEIVADYTDRFVKRFP
jgi:chromatin remodeling complex protein RSC6